MVLPRNNPISMPSHHGDVRDAVRGGHLDGVIHGVGGAIARLSRLRDRALGERQRKLGLLVLLAPQVEGRLSSKAVAGHGEGLERVQGLDRFGEGTDGVGGLAEKACNRFAATDRVVDLWVAAGDVRADAD